MSECLRKLNNNAVAFNSFGTFINIETLSPSLHHSFLIHPFSTNTNASFTLYIFSFSSPTPPPLHLPCPSRYSTASALSFFPPLLPLPYPLPPSLLPSLSISILTSSQSALTRCSRKITSPCFRFNSSLALPRKSNITWNTHACAHTQTHTHTSERSEGSEKRETDTKREELVRADR